MGYEVDEDILQDFLVEASEILEQLSEQLVELEKRPDDRELLNAIFRGFHTVKGGAGFLSLSELVDACHGAENVFDTLRNGQRTVNAELMDVILQALDTINEMFSRVQNREELEPANPELLEALHTLSKPASAAEVAKPVKPTPPPAPEPVAAKAVSPATSGSIDEITQDEFDRLLDELHGSGKPPKTAAEGSISEGGDITDDEFEALLDQLHGQGKHAGVPAGAPAADVAGQHIQDAQSEADALINDDEFEK